MSGNTEEPRRSGRATKGQHKNASSSPVATPKRAKGTNSKPAKKAAEAESNDNEDDHPVRCICGNTDPGDKRAFIGCDACEVWQHNICMGVPDDEDDIPEHYFCEECGPELHQETLQALSRNEKIWETRNKIYQNEKKNKRRKHKGKVTEDAKPGWLKKEFPPVEEPATEVAADVAGDAPNVSAATATAAADVAVPVETGEATQEQGTKRKRDEVKDEPEEKPNLVEERPSRATRQEKRRKSSTTEPKPAETSPLGDADTALVGLDQLPADRLKVAQVLSKIIGDHIDKRVKAGHKLQEDETPKKVGEHHALRIEYALHMNHGSPKDALYATQFRALNANLKKNNTLVARLIDGSVTADELSTMNSSEMASEELQKERAIMKEALDRQAIAIPEEGPRYRQDHKGYRLIEDETQHLTDHPMPRPGASAAKNEDAKGEEAPTPPPPADAARSPPADEPAALSVETRKPSTGGAKRRSSSQQFDMSNIWAKAAHSPTTATPHAGPRLSPTAARRPSSSQPVSGQQNGAKHDPDIDRMLEDNDETYSPTDSTAADAVIWRGKLVQANDENSPTVNARFVAGRDLASTVSWKSLLPESLSIDGRLQIRKAEDYLCGLRWSNTSDVAVLALTPYDNAEAFNATFNYFATRQRYAVVEKGKPPMVKDLYIIPVEVGSKLPDHVDMLEHCTIKQPVEERVLLATLIVARAPYSPPAQIDGTPTQQSAGNLPHHLRQSTGGPAGSPLNTQTPTFSPPNNAAATPAAYGGPGTLPPNPYAPQTPQQTTGYPRQPHANPRVNAILGDLQYEPTAQQILAFEPNLDETRLQNFKAVLTDDPNARTDLNVLSARLFAPR